MSFIIGIACRFIACLLLTKLDQLLPRSDDENQS